MGGVDTAIAVAISFGCSWFVLNNDRTTLAVPIVHFMDAAAEEGNIRKIEMWHVDCRYVCKGSVLRFQQQHC